MDTYGTDIILGKIEMAGSVHGAMNGVVTLYACPEEWFMKQFVSQEQLEEFARDNQLMVVNKQ